MVWKPGAGSGVAIWCSVRSRMSAAGSSIGARPWLDTACSCASMASISACFAAESSGGGGDGTTRGGAAGRNGGGGMDRRGGSVAGRGGGAVAGITGSAAFAGVLVASSSAMILRMEARISSIEGSCPLAA